MTVPSDRSFQHMETFEDVEAFLDNLGLFHMDLGLDRMKNAIRLLNLRFNCPIVQVIGTNGKGSTATFLHSIALSHGFRVGLYTSPHFVSPLERIRMNDRLLPKSAWPSFAKQALTAVPDLTYFELLTVMSLLAYSFAEPDLLIYEAGLGGKNDATTAIPADMLCISPIDLDHTGLLGQSVKEITEEKSQAMREKMFAVVCSPQHQEAMDVIEQRAKDLNIALYTHESLTKLPKQVHLDYPDNEYNELGLKGEHQSMNAQTAVLAWKLLCEKQRWHFEPKAVSDGLSQAFIAGRFQQVKAKNGNPAYVLDGAHNLHSMQSLIDTLTNEKIRPSAFIFSCLWDKEPEKMVAMLEKYLDKNKLDIPIYITPIENNERAIPPAELFPFFKKNAVICQSFAEAVEVCKERFQKEQENNTDNVPPSANDPHGNPVVACGSLYHLSNYYKLFPEALQVSF